MQEVTRLVQIPVVAVQQPTAEPDRAHVKDELQVNALSITNGQISSALIAISVFSTLTIYTTEEPTPAGRRRILDILPAPKLCRQQMGARSLGRTRRHAHFRHEADRRRLWDHHGGDPGKNNSRVGGRSDCNGQYPRETHCAG